MRVLVCGSHGFIGSAVCQTLMAAGHEVVRGVSAHRLRSERSANAVAIDFVADTAPAIWLPRLRGIDAVVNTVGVLRD